MTCNSSDWQCVVEQCSGENGKISGTELFELWNNVYNCPNAYSAKINNGKSGRWEYSATEQRHVRGYVHSLFRNYLSTNEITDDITSPSYNSFQETLLNLCINPSLPGVCAGFLEEYCASFSRDEVSNSPTLINFCGCYTPPDPTYESITNDRNCDPLCHRSLTSHRANNSNGVILSCPQNICVIDDVVINSTNSTVRGGINFTSLCSGCAGTTGMSGTTGPGCLCVVAGINPVNTAGNIGVGFNFSQLCGENSVCITQNSAGEIITQEPCSNVDFQKLIPIPASTYLPPPGIIISFVFLIILVLILVIISRSTRNYEYK